MPLPPRGASLLLMVLAHLGAHLNNAHAALPADGIPAVLGEVIYGALGLGLMWGTLIEPRAGGTRAKVPMHVAPRPSTAPVWRESSLNRNGCR